LNRVADLLIFGENLLV